ncbi:MAG: hypothetical protein DRP06_02860 [Candidatus Aenigmatarchaeota archaeon]|nr:MAG: hypothetical protein DRP06_02860 [Candidatus Aenigmarchaeota archaeon]
MNLDIKIAYTLFGKLEGIPDIEIALKDKGAYNEKLTGKLNEFLGFYDGLTGRRKRREMMTGLHTFNMDYETGHSEGKEYLRNLKK